MSDVPEPQSLIAALSEDQTSRIRTAAGSAYDGDAARPPITADQVAAVVLRAHWDIARCFCPTCVLARELERLRQAMEWYFSRRFGLSSEAMFREAMGLPLEHGGWSPARPWDKGDSQGVEETFAAAPEWMQALMQPRLDWYREIARLGWPIEAPEREAVPS